MKTKEQRKRCERKGRESKTNMCVCVCVCKTKVIKVSNLDTPIA